MRPMRNVQVSDGSFITDEESTELAKVAVLGPTVVDPILSLPATEPVGQTSASTGSSSPSSASPSPKALPADPTRTTWSTFRLRPQQLYLAGNSYLSTIDVQAASAGSMTQVQNDITSLLLQLHGISNPGQR